MKFLLTITFIISGLIANAQVLDSLDITLPWDEINIYDCYQSLGEGPYTDNDEIFISEGSLKIVENEDGECILITRRWDILSFADGQAYEYIQLAKVNQTESFEVVEDRVIVYADLPLSISAEELVVDADETHEYSFSYSDVADNARSFDVNNIEGSAELTIYNHTTKSVNEVSVYFTVCEEEVLIDFPTSVEMEFNGEPYLFITEELLDYTIIYPCSPYEVIISYNEFNTINSSQIGTSVEVVVVIDPEVGPSLTEYVNIFITGTPPPPIPMYIEEKTFSAGEEVTFDIWSDGLDELIAWQFRLSFENAVILNVESGSTFGEIPHNIFNEGKTINTIWFPWDVVPVDMASNETWFTLTVLPEVDGSTLDIFTTENDPWSVINIVDEVDFVEYGVDFSFTVAERNILSDNSTQVAPTFSIANNPAGDLLTIHGLESLGSEYQLDVIAIDGQRLMSNSYAPIGNTQHIDISSLNSGLYIISIINNQKTQSLQFIKM